MILRHARRHLAAGGILLSLGGGLLLAGGGATPGVQAAGAAPPPIRVTAPAPAEPGPVLPTVAAGCGANWSHDTVAVPDRAHDGLFTARVTAYPDPGFAVHRPDACR
jgi:hypothetical protein